MSGISLEGRRLEFNLVINHTYHLTLQDVLWNATLTCKLNDLGPQSSPFQTRIAHNNRKACNNPPLQTLTSYGTKSRTSPPPPHPQPPIRCATSTPPTRPRSMEQKRRSVAPQKSELARERAVLFPVAQRTRVPPALPAYLAPLGWFSTRPPDPGISAQCGVRHMYVSRQRAGLGPSTCAR